MCSCNQQRLLRFINRRKVNLANSLTALVDVLQCPPARQSIAIPLRNGEGDLFKTWPH